ncbi:hypothetical protein IE4803_CH03042 [Rhizobium etli bv. phaseoli str. IE4803]|nr:hypothetical protein IE4803_CH03042 [Rhizobium etli bv. phaseoli str. IE4803]
MAMPTVRNAIGSRSTRLQSFGLETHKLMKLSEKPRMIPVAVNDPLRKVASIFSSVWGSDMGLGLGWLLRQERQKSGRPTRPPSLPDATGTYRIG